MKVVLAPQGLCCERRRRLRRLPRLRPPADPDRQRGRAADVLNEQFPDGSPRPPRHLAPLAFRRLFTDGERLAIHAAAQANAVVAMWVMDGAAAQVIDLDDPATIAALDTLVEAGLLTAARRDQILG